MPLRLVTGPSQTVVSLAEAKAHLSMESETAWDSLITGLIAAAQQHLDGRDGVLNRCLSPQTWELVEDGFPMSAAVRLPLPPLRSVASVRYYDAEGVLQTLSASAYTVDTVSQPGWIALNAGESWPDTADMINAVIVRFEAGYDTIPQPVKHAALLLIGHWFANRESVLAGGTSAIVLPMAVDALIAPYRVWSFG